MMRSDVMSPEAAGVRAARAVRHRTSGRIASLLSMRWNRRLCGIGFETGSAPDDRL